MRIVEPVNNIILRYRNLVWKCANGIKLPPYIEKEDIIQEGYLGLLKAQQKFNPKEGIKFITYAVPYIRGYILRAIYKNCSLLSKIGLKRLSDKNLIKLPTVLYTPTGKDNDNNGFNWELVPAINSSVDEIEQAFDYYSLKNKFDLFLKCIRPQQRRAIELYYFTLNNEGKHLSYREVAEQMGITFQRAQQLVVLGRKALKKRFGEYLNVYI